MKTEKCDLSEKELLEKILSKLDQQPNCLIIVIPAVALPMPEDSDPLGKTKKSKDIPLHNKICRGNLFLESNGSVAHAACGRDGRQKGRERGYYHLRRNLNDSFFHKAEKFTSSILHLPSL